MEIDSSNQEIYLFGGYGYAINSELDQENADGYLSDLWIFKVDIGQWAFIHGSPYVDQMGNYGTKGQDSPYNNPGGRTHITSFMDERNRIFYIFYGHGLADQNPIPGYLNDGWKFSITQLEGNFTYSTAFHIGAGLILVIIITLLVMIYVSRKKMNRNATVDEPTKFVPLRNLDR
jgi:hypothetical protein